MQIHMLCLFVNILHMAVSSRSSAFGHAAKERQERNAGRLDPRTGTPRLPLFQKIALEPEENATSNNKTCIIKSRWKPTLVGVPRKSP